MNVKTENSKIAKLKQYVLAISTSVTKNASICRSKYDEASAFVASVKKWNAFPNEIKSLEFKRFKIQLKKFLLSSYDDY